MGENLSPAEGPVPKAPLAETGAGEVSSPAERAAKGSDLLSLLLGSALSQLGGALELSKAFAVSGPPAGSHQW